MKSWDELIRLTEPELTEEYRNWDQESLMHRICWKNALNYLDLVIRRRSFVRKLPFRVWLMLLIKCPLEQMNFYLIVLRSLNYGAR